MYDLEYEPVIAAAGRWDLYGPVHKGLRLAQAQMMARLGAANWACGEAGLIADLRAHLRLAARHLAHAHIHPALEARDPGASAVLVEDHERHGARLAVLEAQIAALEMAFPPDAPALGRALYLGFAQWVAEDLSHMHYEETVIWPRLCAAFADEELRAIEMTIIGALAPEDAIAFMRLMIPAMNRAERAGLLGGVKADAPPEAFAAVMELAARPTLAPEDWADLVSRGLAA